MPTLYSFTCGTKIRFSCRVVQNVMLRNVSDEASVNLMSSIVFLNMTFDVV